MPSQFEDSARDAFRLRLFRGFSAQRRALVEAEDIFEEPLHEELEAQLEAMREVRIEPGRSNLWLDLVGCTRRLLGTSVLLNVLATLAMFCSVLATRAILDKDAPGSVALILCLGFLLAETCSHAVGWFEARVRAQVGRTVAVRILGLISRKLVGLSIGERSRFSSGNLKTMVASDSESVAEFYENLAWEGIPSAVILLLSLPVIWLSAGVAGITALAVSCLQIPIAMVLGRVMTRYHGQVRTQEDRLSTLVGEWIRNIRLVRYLGWQGIFQRDIAQLYRRLATAGAKEHSFAIIAYGISFCWWMTPMLSAVLVAMYSSKPTPLANLFASFWVVNHLSNHLRYIPQTITLYAKARASQARLCELLCAPETATHFVPSSSPLPDSANPLAVRLEDVSVRVDGKLCTDHVSLRFPLHERTALVGPVGCGKTSVLKVIAGEIPPSEGRVMVEFSDGTERDLWEEEAHGRLRSSLAIVPQEAFLSNTSLRSNISLAGSSDEGRVNDALDRAEMRYDTMRISGGLDGEIGESGINLSGGQRQRVNIARALYADRPWLLLDDPLSAVDPRTERRLVSTLLNGDSGFLIASHRLSEIPKMDRVVFIEDGHPVEDGKPTDLLKRPSSKFTAFASAGMGVDPKAAAKAAKKARLDALVRRSSESGIRGSAHAAVVIQEPVAPQELEEGGRDSGQFTSEEATGKDDSSGNGILLRYLGSLSLLKWIAAPSLLFVVLATSIPQAFLWLSGEVGACGKASACRVVALLPWGGRYTFRGSFALLAGCFLLALLFRLLCWAIFEQSGQWASQGLHSSMIRGLARARTTFFDENPSGRIIKRVMGDFDCLRLTGIVRIGDATNAFAEVLFVSLVSLMASPWAIILTFPLAGFFYHVQRNVSPMLERSGRLLAAEQGDVIHRQTDLIDGASVFAIYGAVPEVHWRLESSVRRFVRARLLETLVAQWSRFWAGLATSVYAACVLALVSYSLQKGLLSEALAAVILSALFRIAPCFDWLAWSTAYLGETKASARRVFEYVDLPPESEAELAPGVLNPAGRVEPVQPSTRPQQLTGDIEFVDYTMSYRQETPEILRGLSVKFESGRRTGIVGRSGAGKTSIVQALYRMVHVRGGDIRIGGKSIFGFDADFIRGHFGIVPQEPYLFEGTVRTNLDREGVHDDASLRRALDAVGLKVELCARVLEGGRNFSTGQRQLVCLARALVADRPFIVLDEPTSGIDVETDVRIQRVLADAMRGKTILAIAHRMETLARYDHVVEFSQGALLREGRPETFLRN